MNNIFIFISAILSFQRVTSLTMEDMDSIKIYYDEHGSPVPMLTNLSDVVPTLKTPNVRFGPLPCSCQDLTCGCCVNMNIQLFNFTRHGCTNFTYDPYNFSIGMNMLWNEESIYQTSVSGKNPPPICVQAPVPYLPSMDQCVRIFNIFTPGRNIHMCVNLETRIERVPILILQFDCMRMGADGVALLKPEAEGGLKPPEETEENTPSEASQEAANVLDPVDPDKKKSNQTTEGNVDNKNGTNIEKPTSTETLKEDTGMVNKKSESNNIEVNSINAQVNTHIENTSTTVIKDDIVSLNQTGQMKGTKRNVNKIKNDNRT